MNIRVMSFNIHKGIGGVLPKSTISKIRRRIRELHPDVILLQEIQGSQFEAFTTEIWPHFTYGRNAVYTKGHHGNAILSKFPIHFTENIDISMHRYERRGLLHSVIKLSAEHELLHLLCVHLGLFKRGRRKQLDKIGKFIQTRIKPHEPLILGGDFNDWTDFATPLLVEKLGLQEAFLNSHGAYARTYPVWAPVLKLDRLYLRGFHINHAHRLIQKPWRYLSDHTALEVSLRLIV